MVVLNKKRILFIVFAVVIAVFIPVLQHKDMESIETVALPVSNKVIVLDAGHRLSR